LRSTSRSYSRREISSARRYSSPQPASWTCSGTPAPRSGVSACHCTASTDPERLIITTTSFQDPAEHHRERHHQHRTPEPAPLTPNVHIPLPSQTAIATATATATIISLHDRSRHSPTQQPLHGRSRATQRLSTCWTAGGTTPYPATRPRGRRQCPRPLTARPGAPHGARDFGAPPREAGQ
jgi:hypothetical protein